MMSSQKTKNNFNLDLLTYFPQIHQSYLDHSFFKNIIKNEFNLNLHNILNISRQNNIFNDKKPYGHNKGMLLGCHIVDYIFSKIPYLQKKQTIIIHPSPSGYKLNTEIVQQITQFKNFIFICSRYEGIDARIIKHYNALEISIGDYILFDGDTAAMVIYNAIIRDMFVKTSAKIEESFYNNLLEYDQYCYPVCYKNHIVPPVLREGNHKLIQQWKKQNSILKTIQKRIDLYSKYKK